MKARLTRGATIDNSPEAEMFTVLCAVDSQREYAMACDRYNAAVSQDDRARAAIERYIVSLSVSQVYLTEYV